MLEVMETPGKLYAPSATLWTKRHAHVALAGASLNVSAIDLSPRGTGPQKMPE